jgi:hypothetical protein
MVLVLTAIVILLGCRFWDGGPDEPPEPPEPRVSQVDVKVTVQRRKKLVGKPGIWTVQEKEPLAPGDR